MRKITLFVIAAMSTAIQAKPAYTTYNYVDRAIENATSNAAQKFSVGDLGQGGVIFYVVGPEIFI